MELEAKKQQLSNNSQSDDKVAADLKNEERKVNEAKKVVVEKEIALQKSLNELEQAVNGVEVNTRGKSTT